MRNTSPVKGQAFYYSIRVKPYNYKREFVIEKFKIGNSFHYAHRLCNLVFKTQQETEKAILKRLITQFDMYITLKNELIYGAKPNNNYNIRRGFNR